MTITFIVVLIAIVAVAALLLIWRPWAAVKHVKRSQPQGPKQIEISPETIAALQQQLEQSYRHQIETATAGFSHDLAATSTRLSEQVERLTTEVISRELEEYGKTLDSVRGVAEKAASQIQTAVAQQQAELQKTMQAAVATEQQRRLDLVDQRLSEIISSYLVECLGEGVDLGAQTDYIIGALEARKDDIRKDLSSGV